MTKILTLFALAACTLAGADATGKWSGNLSMQAPDGAAQTRPAYLVLKQEGAKLTGTAGPSADEQYDIQDGKAEDGRLTFTVAQNGMNFSLKLDGDEITGEITRERNGETQRAKLEVKRQP